MKELQQTLEYEFSDERILRQALTHSSKTSDIHQNYERLEFLGDRILGVTVAEMLCRMFPDEPEGNLSQRFIGLVCKETVAEVVTLWGADKYIIVANPDASQSENVLCDVGEAIIAAIYKDSQSMQVAQDFVRKNWLPLIDRKSKPHKDYKTRLQEEVHNLNLQTPVYRVLEKTGSEHKPEFLMEVWVGDGVTAEGHGKNKKIAEQEAACKMLKSLGIKDV